MALVRSFDNWNRRPSDEQVQIEPYRKYFIIAEGLNTERWYFNKLISLKKELHIHPLIDVCYLERTDEDAGLSNPLQLLELASKQRETDDFDAQCDRMIVIFDADIYEREGARSSGLDEIITQGSEENILGITNPSFELFLLLHFDGAYENDISGNEQNIIANRKIQQQRYINTLLKKYIEFNPKKNENIGELAKYVWTAIEQEKKVNQDITSIHGRVTSNIGSIIQSIIDDNATP